jgi:hypothetical protein
MLASWTEEDKVQYILDRLTDEILQQQVPVDKITVSGRTEDT